MKRPVWFFLIAAVVVSPTFGEGASESEPDETVITWWDPDTREDWINATQIVIDRFEADTGITVERVTVPWNNVDTRMQVAAAAGTLPDLVSAFHNFHSAWAFQGHLSPLDDVLDEIGREDFYSPHLDMSTVDGRTYSVPLIFYPHIVYYRTDLYEKHGLSIPQSWDQLYENARTIDENEEDVYGFMVYNGPGNPYVLIDLMGANGAATFDADGNVVIDSPETVDALEFLGRLVELSPPGSLQRTSGDLRIPFVQGQGAHMMDSTSLANVILSEGRDDIFGAFPVPVNSGERGAMNDFIAFVMTRQADSEATRQFLTYFFRDENLSDFARNAVVGHIPARQSIAESDAYLESEKIAPFRSVFEAAIAVGQNGVGLGMTNGPNRYTGAVRAQNIWGTMVDRMILMNESPQTVSSWAQQEIEGIVADTDG